MQARKRVQKREVDFEAMVASGSTGAYEALQLYRSKATRSRAKGETMAAIKMLAEGAKLLLKNNYETAGSELATFFVEMVGESKFDLGEELRKLVYEIDDEFPKESSARVDFLKGCVKWSIATGKRELGDTSMQTRLGQCLYGKKDKTAAFHFAAGEAPAALCTLIFSTYKEKNEQEKRDQSLALGVTNFLALENLRDAHELLFQFKTANKSKRFPADSKLLQFVEFLLQTSRRDAAPLFKQLVNAYADELDFDEAVPALLMGPIALKLFGIKPKITPFLGLMLWAPVL
ncbi:hypothetical protein B484DRAFT_392957 [Ochromonadaceae sp. CCMP2298]|nr:hypothetical protein B484DRAFT_392957 [Ochromonadaceae sp. CCMP2298]